jgi:hypothetical protein
MGHVTALGRRRRGPGARDEAAGTSLGAGRRPDVTPRPATAAVVGVVGGSRSDFPVLEQATAMLDRSGAVRAAVVSAHRSPDLLFRYAETAPGRGIRVIIAGAGGAAHLPGMLAAKTTLPVIGVPMPTKALGRPRLAPLDRPDAARHPGRDGRDRQRRERRAACGRDPRPGRRGARRAPRRVPRRPDAGWSSTTLNADG